MKSTIETKLQEALETVVVTVVANGYLWVYAITEEQAETVMAAMEENMTHFERLMPGKCYDPGFRQE